MHDVLAIDGGTPVRQAPFAPWPIVCPEIAAAVTAVVESGHWWQCGSGQAEELEAWLAHWFSVNDAIAVSNGTVALELALRSLGVGYGDEVIVPALTFISTASAVKAVGATAVPADIDPTTLNIAPSSVVRAIGSRTKAVIAVHMAGQPADLGRLEAVCFEAGLYLIEDCAHVLSATRDGIRAGQAGTLATLSFQAAKLLPGGDGGAVLVPRNAPLADAIRRAANCGRDRGTSGYDHSFPATNARISEFAASVVLAHRGRVAEFDHSRAEHALETLAALPVGAVMPPHPATTRHDWYMLLLRVPERLLAAGIDNARFAELLTAEGIPSRQIYPAWPSLPDYAGPIETCPVAAAAARNVVWLHHSLLLDSRLAPDLHAAWEKVCDCAA